MTPERIAEIEAWVTGAVPTHSDALSQDDILHLCRLARLGLRVESAPTGTCEELGDSDLVKDQYRWKGLAAVVFPDNDDPESGPVMEVGKRVALVLLEESK